jgi:hypothetical protein
MYIILSPISNENSLAAEDLSARLWFFQYKHFNETLMISKTFSNNYRLQYDTGKSLVIQLQTRRGDRFVKVEPSNFACANCTPKRGH